MIRRNLLAIALAVLGCARMAAYFSDSPNLRRIGEASGVAPLPSLLGGAGGAGDSSARLTLRGVDGEGRVFQTAITPELCASIEGPDARRLAYLSALCRARQLPVPLRDSVWRRGFEDAGPLARAFAVPPGAHALTLTLQIRVRGRDDSWVLSPSSTK